MMQLHVLQFKIFKGDHGLVVEHAYHAESLLFDLHHFQLQND